MDILQMYRGGHACVTMQNESGDYFRLLVMNIVEFHIIRRTATKNKHDLNLQSKSARRYFRYN